jgi:proteasome assembly chaperone (PAC2) family protein
MTVQGIEIDDFPRLTRPVLIAGFDGWGNAMGVSRGMADYLIRKLEAQPFAYLEPDSFFRYDEQRPMVNIEEGVIQNISIPGGSFYAARTSEGARDVVIFASHELSSNWFQFIHEFFYLCFQLGIETVITLGSMYDNVLHTERRISGIVSNHKLSVILKKMGVLRISYNGPTAIHSIIQSEGEKKGFYCASLWCHCPYYFQGSNHFGLMSSLGKVLAFLAEFDIDTGDLEKKWKTMEYQIDKLVAKNPEIQKIISNIRKSQSTKNIRPRPREVTKGGTKIIDLKDFLDPK